MKRNLRIDWRILRQVPVLVGVALTLFLLCKGLLRFPSEADASPSKVPTANSVSWRNIEDIRVGDRVITDVPDSIVELANEGRKVQEWERKPNPVDGFRVVDSQVVRLANSDRWEREVAADFHVVDLAAPRVDGTISRVVLLRPRAWLERKQLEVGQTVRIDVPECGIRGHAEILGIRDHEPVTSGRGQIVTGTFVHAASSVIDISIEGESKAIGATANHPFYSVDRHAFVRADELHRGERLDTARGIRRVVFATPRRGRHPVCNIEVAFHHVYRVGRGGVLVHNSGDCSPGAGGHPNADRLAQLGQRNIDLRRQMENVQQEIANAEDALNRLSGGPEDLSWPQQRLGLDEFHQQRIQAAEEALEDARDRANRMNREIEENLESIDELL